MKSFQPKTVLLILFLAGCGILDSEISGTLDARIVPGLGVDGVHFGDSRDEVRAKLGPSNGGGITDGLYASHFASDYEEGPHAGLSVYFLEQPINTAGPVDILTVHAPYEGKTSEGVEIDSPVSDVREAYGVPRVVYGSESSERYTYVYCINGSRLQIGFREDRVVGMGLGYYESPPNNECR